MAVCSMHDDPGLDRAAAAVLPLVEQHRKDPSAEFEARIGTFPAGRFQNGTGRATIDRVVRTLSHSKYMIDLNKNGWAEEHDFFIDTADGRSLRTRVRFCDTEMQIQHSTIEKQSLGCVTVRGDACAIRVSLKTEKEVPSGALPAAATPVWVRIKQKRSFTTLDGVWRFDVAMTWSGVSKTAAEKQQMHSEPVYEVECELAKPHEYLATHTDMHVAKSILMKLRDFLPNPSSELTV